MECVGRPAGDIGVGVLVGRIVKVGDAQGERGLFTYTSPPATSVTITHTRIPAINTPMTMIASKGQGCLRFMCQLDR